MAKQEKYEADKKELYEYQMGNIYNQDKHYNPHNVIGVEKLTRAQNKLLD